MSWGAFILAVVKLAGTVAAWAQQNQLLSAGEATAIAAAHETNAKFLRQARALRDEITADPDGDLANSVRDKYTRRD